MTMLVVTHEMGFAKSVAHRVLFMDYGRIVEQNTPAEFFDNPQHDRTKLFLSQICTEPLITANPFMGKRPCTPQTCARIHLDHLRFNLP
jgi:ABC-type dipeptide/oligopeptide/nickel transport system ATPase component